jgi:hypothetical protein
MNDDELCPGEHDWIWMNDSYDDAFGTVRIAPYQSCNCCPATRAVPEQEY